MKNKLWQKILVIYTLSIDVIEIGHLHDGALLLLPSESFRVCFLVQIRAFVI